jgi:NAD(P)-dependent dehydrogenase (short-subunit alcohol dehydrogenase family)
MFLHRSLAGRVVVVTGASSGLGRETAVQFAGRGCTLVLAARRGAELDETARLCWIAGGSALPVVTDVTDEKAVHELARAALRHAGRIDIWVNNAGVALTEPLESGPFEVHRRVIETNLYGAIYGARAVVPIFRNQGHGVLINVCSVAGKVGQPFVPAYVISKFALRGLTEALRSELARERRIHICSIFPYAIDTPHFDDVGESGAERRLRMLPRVQPKARVARAIVRMAERPHHERHVPRSATLGIGLHRLFPRTTERLLARARA